MYTSFHLAPILGAQLHDNSPGIKSLVLCLELNIMFKFSKKEIRPKK